MCPVCIQIGTGTPAGPSPPSGDEQPALKQFDEQFFAEPRHYEMELTAVLRKHSRY